MIKKLSLDELNRLSVDEFKTTEKIPVVVVLDSIRSLHNVGSAFRTADAFAVEKLYLCGITGSPPNKEIHKTALGATESIAWEHVEDVVALVKKLKEQGYRLLPVEQASGSMHLNQFQIRPGEKLALIFGNEVFGVSEEVIAVADSCLEIPQFGTKHSLNVSVAMGVVLWEIVRGKLGK
jgi:23S rRNA (guanosine2251-2'-O)-methyltransferase